MSSETNVAALERMAELVNTGDLGHFGEVVDQDAVDHDPAPDQKPGPEGFRDFFGVLLGAFPDLKLTPVTVVCDDEHVCMAYTITGTHQGDVGGIHGKLIERWGSSDEMGIMKQLGMTIEP